ncbi:MAG: hypothetical protein B5766_06430 [Candidatus Lumbricidophila eiseniae]|uniref:Uncharacterized protein n=1 Tax=Candidatus Lumbricidiphila eiseniae TaxID=1969409 RepID=A0A2A6FR53_9MICO|nr:MAG: hypothetical protein B5766_06430 [Candidatus Lumbricidophila eiseniae]
MTCSGVPEYRVGASASYGAARLGARVNLYEMFGAQRLLAAGTASAVTDAAQTPWIGLDFQPTIGTQVASTYVAEGDSFADLLTVGTVGSGTWIVIDGQPVELTATGTLYGPFDEQPAEAETAPTGAPIVGTETLLLNGTGEYTSSGSLTATESGFYTWVWGIDKAAQGENGKYIRGSFMDWFGRVAETHVTPFQPEAVSNCWVETFYSPDGEVLHRGECGAAGETTKVVKTPDTPTVTPPVTPPGPSVLASTGAGWSLAGLIAGLVLLTTGGMLWFGRKLAQHCARTATIGDGKVLPDTE